MAMFHFRLKSDKKPNGTKISAVKHVEYINREGAFSDDGHRQGVDKFVGNFITTEKIPNALIGDNVLLYLPKPLSPLLFYLPTKRCIISRLLSMAQKNLKNQS